MLGQDTLNVLVSAIGVQKTISEIRAVREEVRNIVADARTSAALGVGAIVASAGVATVAFKEYEAVRSLTANLQQIYGNEGVTLSKEINQIGRSAYLSKKEVEGLALQMARAGQSGREMVQMVRMLDRIAGGTGGAADINSINKTINAVREAGRVSAAHIEQLLMAGAPVHEVARRRGYDDPMLLAGSDAADFTRELIRVTEQMKQMGEASRLIRNTFTDIKDALAPTGGHIVAMIRAVTNVTRSLIGAFRAANEATKGYVGLAVVIGLFVGGVMLIVRAGRMLVGSFLRLSAAANGAAVALSTAGAAAKASAAGNAVNAPYMIWNKGGTAGGIGMIAKIIAGVTTIIRIVASVTTVLLKFVVGPLVALLGFIYALEELTRAVGAWREGSVGVSSWVRGMFGDKDEARKFKAGVWRMPWQGKEGSGGSSEGTPPAYQPVRRSSIENAWDKAYARSVPSR